MDNPTHAQLALQTLGHYDQHIQSHKTFREHAISAIMLIDGFSFPFLLSLDSNLSQFLGVLLIVSITMLVYYIGEKNLGMVIHYQHLRNRTFEAAFPEEYKRFMELENGITASLSGRSEIEGIEKLRGTLGVSYRTSFRTFWRLFVIVSISLFVSVLFIG